MNPERRKVHAESLELELPGSPDYLWDQTRCMGFIKKTELSFLCLKAQSRCAARQIVDDRYCAIRHYLSLSVIWWIVFLSWVYSITNANFGHMNQAVKTGISGHYVTHCAEELPNYYCGLANFLCEPFKQLVARSNRAHPTNYFRGLHLTV